MATNTRPIKPSTDPNLVIERFQSGDAVDPNYGGTGLTNTELAGNVGKVLAVNATADGYTLTTAGGGGGGGGVESVTGDSVDNTDPANPVVNAVPYTLPNEAAISGNNAFLGGTAVCKVVNFSQTDYSATAQLPFFGIYSNTPGGGQLSSIGIYDDGVVRASIETSDAAAGYVSQSVFKADEVLQTVSDYNTGNVYSYGISAAYGFVVQSVNGIGNLIDSNDLRTKLNNPLRLVGLSTSQRDALTPEEGWVIYNLDTHKMQVYVGALGWEDCN